MKNICVYCGSSTGKGRKYKQAANELGKCIANNKFNLIYGGGNVGLMGEIANSVLKNGGKVIGVIPKNLFKRELAKKDITKLIIAKDMHHRKALMAKLADTFIAIPGGIGTLEEFSEAVTWNQLLIHHKPCGLLNTEGYYDHLIRFLNHSIKNGFFSLSEKSNIFVSKNPKKLLEMLRKAKKTKFSKKWKDFLE